MWASPFALVAGALVVGEPAGAAEPEAGGAGGASAPAGTLLESIVVPVDGSTTVSTTALAADTHYTLLATGEFRIGGPGFGDAEYAYSGTDQGPIDNCFDSPAGTDLGIGIDDANVGATSKSPDWGPFNAAHEYTVDIVGAGKPISLNYHDCGHGDNGPAAGRLPLTVSIFGPPTEKNLAPVAVLDLADITAGTPGTPLYPSDDPDLSSPVQLVGPERLIAFDASRSTDPDGTEDIVSYSVSVTGGPVGEPPSVTTAFTPTGAACPRRARRPHHPVVDLGDRDRRERRLLDGHDPDHARSGAGPGRTTGRRSPCSPTFVPTPTPTAWSTSTPA